MPRIVLQADPPGTITGFLSVLRNISGIKELSTSFMPPFCAPAVCRKDSDSRRHISISADPTPTVTAPGWIALYNVSFMRLLFMRCHRWLKYLKTVKNSCWTGLTGCGRQEGNMTRNQNTRNDKDLFDFRLFFKV
jgi:hypothetical protein